MKKIPPSIKEIIDVIKNQNYTPLTMKDIAQILSLDSNTVNQRIIRAKAPFFLSKGTKTKVISLNMKCKEVIHYLRKNQCYLCKKKGSENTLEIFHLNGRKDDFEIQNVVLLCKKCKKNSPLIPQHREKMISNNFNRKSNRKIAWEYKKILIRFLRGSKIIDSQSKNDKLAEKTNYDYFFHYQFMEVDNDNKIAQNHWKYFGKNKETTTFSINNILNYFGKDGWEYYNHELIIYSERYLPNEFEAGAIAPINMFGTPWFTHHHKNVLKEYEYYFKRRIEE